MSALSNRSNASGKTTPPAASQQASAQAPLSLIEDLGDATGNSPEQTKSTRQYQGVTYAMYLAGLSLVYVVGHLMLLRRSAASSEDVGFGVGLVFYAPVVIGAVLVLIGGALGVPLRRSPLPAAIRIRRYIASAVGLAALAALFLVH